MIESLISFVIRAIWFGVGIFLINIILYIFGAFGYYASIAFHSINEIKHLSYDTLVRYKENSPLGLDANTLFPVQKMRNHLSRQIMLNLCYLILMVGLTWYLLPEPLNQIIPIILIIVNILTVLGVQGFTPAVDEGGEELQSIITNPTAVFNLGIRALIVSCICIIAYIHYFQSTPSTTINAETSVINELNSINAQPVADTTPSPTIARVFEGEVITRSLRVRAKPNTQGAVILGLQKGQKIQIIGISADNLWLFVEYQTDKFGWVSRDFVTVNDESSLPQLDEQAAQDYVATLANNPITSQKTTNDVNGLYVYPRLLTDIRAISAKSYSFLALRNDGSVVMWGNDACGKGKLPSQSNISTISAGGSFCMALTTDKTLVIWGSAKSPATNPPQTLNIAKISAGYFHALALTEDGQVLAWGDNEFQQCDVPVFTSRVVDIRAGVDSSIALLSDGSAVIWGQNMAAGTYQNVRDIAPAYNHSAILFSDGSVKIAGEMMGAGYEFPSSSDYIAIAADEQAQIAIRRDTTVVGGGYYGSMTVTTPSNLTNIVAIATGINQSLALHSDGSVTQFGETQLTP